MSYTLTLTNGTLLENLTDGSLDTTTTSVGLIGRNYAGYGQSLNENFIKMLEHFSNSTAPTNPLKGQIWYDSTNAVLKVYNGTAWKEITNTNPSSSAPSNSQTGDFWWDSTNSFLKLYNGSSWITIGPVTPPGAAVTSLVPNNLTDQVSAVHTVGNIMINNKLAAIISSDTTSFTPASPSLAGGFTTITPGYNVLNNMLVGGTVTANGLAITGTATFNGAPIATTSGGGTASFAAINSTPIGNTTPSTGAFTTTTTGGLQAVAIGNVTPGTGAFTTTTTGGLQAVAIGNVTPGTGAFTTLSATGATTLTTLSVTTLSVTGNITPTANLSYNLGSTSAWFNNIYGTAIHAQYADLAERFASDQPYSAGTVVELGGPAEIMAAGQDLSDNVFGVISTNAAYLMNSGAGSNTTHPPVAVQGRVPVRVTGIIRKGDRLVSAGNGLARAGARNEITAWNVIGRALADKLDSGEGLIEAVVKLNS